MGRLLKLLVKIMKKTADERKYGGKNEMWNYVAVKSNDFGLKYKKE